MVGPTENLAKGWELIRQSRVSADGEKKPGLTMDDTLGVSTSPVKRSLQSPGNVSAFSSTICPNSWNNASRCTASSS
eukprot:15097085-Alexandrium_andersonii.AAC.1